MTKRLDAVDLTRTFLTSANKICRSRPQLREQIDKTLTILLANPESGGLHREPIRCPWTDELWSCRVTKSVRLLEAEVGQRRALAFNVGNHDSMYGWAQRHSGTDTDDIAREWQGSRGANPRADSEQCPDSDTVSRDDRAHGIWSEWADSGRMPEAIADDISFSCIPHAELMALGLDDKTAARVRRAPIDVELTSFGISVSTAEAIARLYSKHERRATGLLMADEVIQREITEAPVPVPVRTASDVVRITAAGQFSGMLDMGLDRYLTMLTDEQRSLAEQEQHGLLVVKGSGGSGKTTVAVHRVRYLADQIAMQPTLGENAPRRVIYVCYNRTLAQVVRQMLVTLYGKQVPSSIEVSTLHQWARAYLERRGVLNGPRNRSGQAVYRSVKNDAVGRMAALAQRARHDDTAQQQFWARYTPRFVAAEITQVIVGRGLTKEDEYLTAERTGRGGRLKAEDRRAIWHLYEVWRDTLRRARAVDLSMIPGLALEALAQDATFSPYQAVIVDEAQDCTPVLLRLATRMAGGVTARVTIFADAAQALYGTGFRWKLAELNPRGNQLRTLNRNHRNTLQIHAAAVRLLSRGGPPDEPDAYVTPRPPEAEGSMPELLVCDGEEAEVREVCRRVCEQINAGVPAQTIGIMAGTNARVRRMAEELRLAGIETESPRESGRLSITHPSVKVLTMHGAKGLDFPHVYVIGLTADGLPGAETSTPIAVEAPRSGLMVQRRLLYTAMIRAGRTLTLTTIAEAPHPLLDDLDDDVCQRVRVQGRP
jgi:superfamily I DNA/RNA helicase